MIWRDCLSASRFRLAGKRASVLSGPALACADDEALLFSCQTQDEAHVIRLCAVRDDAAGGYQSLQYRYGTAEADELVFPENRRDGRRTMLFAHHFSVAGLNWTLRFDNGGYRYIVFFAAQAEDDDPDTIVGPDAGVEVWRKGKRLARVKCGERPHAYASDIHKAAGCDAETPLGTAACADNPPAVK